MKTIQKIFYLIICFAALVAGCAEEPKMSDNNIIGALAPTVILDRLNNITATEATVYGKITSKGGTEIEEKGFYWYKEGETVPDSSFVVTEGEDGLFYMTLTGLIGSTKYYVYAYARNSVDEAPSDTDSLKTEYGIFNTEATYSGPPLEDRSAAYVNGTYRNQMSGYLIGGTSNGIPTNEFWEFNPDDELQPWKQWTTTRPVPAKRSQSSAVYAVYPGSSSAIYFFGGLDEDDQPRNDLYAFDINGSWWDTLTPLDPPSPRYASALGFAGGLVYNIGGILRGADGKETITDEVHRLRSFSSAWDEMKKFPEAQCNSLVFSVNDTIYAGLGQTSLGDSPTFSNRFFVSKTSSIEEGIWTELPTMPGTKALGSAMVGTNIYVIDDEGYIHIFDMQNKKWKEKSESRRLPVKSRKIHCVYGFAEDGKLYIGLGEDSREIISYDPGWDTDN